MELTLQFAEVWDGTDLKRNLDVLIGDNISYSVINLSVLHNRVEQAIASIVEEEAKKAAAPRRGRKALRVSGISPADARPKRVRRKPRKGLVTR